MPVVTLNPALVAIRGRVGDVVFKTYRDKVVMTRVPRFVRLSATPAQRERRNRLKAATQFAQRVYGHDEAKALYVEAARRLDRQAFRLAVSDYLRCAGEKPRRGDTGESARLAAAARLLVSRASFPSRPPRSVTLSARVPKGRVHGGPRLSRFSAAATLGRMKSIRESLARVAELPGLYGPFSFSEKLLQKIWLQGDFDRSRLATIDGDRVQVLHAGKWNLLGGPDFSGARLRLGSRGDPIVQGDVEVHLRAEDWVAHRHASDPAYDRVVLHVVLFPPARGYVTRSGDGRGIPVVALLPLLFRGLEEFAEEDAVERLADRPRARLPEELGKLPSGEAMERLRGFAHGRWEQKVRSAQLRVDKLGWREACHATTLEILGFRFNRTPMLRVASRWPQAAWGEGLMEAETAFAAEAGGWSLQGVRPANHPRVRLRQYERWNRARPDWTSRLAEFAPLTWTDDLKAATRTVRKEHEFAHLRERMNEEFCGSALGGARFDTLVCDGWLPLLATRRGGKAGEAVWFHWFPGDLPDWVRAGLRELGLLGGPASPATHGMAQGLLGWCIETERRAHLFPCQSGGGLDKFLHH